MQQLQTDDQILAKKRNLLIELRSQIEYAKSDMANTAHRVDTRYSKNAVENYVESATELDDLETQYQHALDDSEYI